jgi:hypothetical protein
VKRVVGVFVRFSLPLQHVHYAIPHAYAGYVAEITYGSMERYLGKSCMITE